MTLAGSFGGAGTPPGARRIAAGPLAARADTAAFATAGDGVTCVLDGSLADAGSLAAELGIDPALPAAALVAQGYERLGAAVFAHLHGAWIAVLWDAGRGRGAIARDRGGERPLHLCAHAGGLLFASEVSDLLALLPRRPPPDEDWLAHWLARRPAPAELTPYAGIQRLPAGHAAVLAGTRWSIAPWWRPRPRPPLDLGASDAALALREAMGAAVERAAGDARAPGVLLSGGFDSASVAALAARDRPLRAYSGLFPDHPQVDESGRIQAVRAALALPGIEQELRRGGGALGATFDFIRAFGLPPASPNLFVWRTLMDAAVADGADVLLDGEGGDELFGCSPPLIGDALRAGRPGEALALARRLPGMGAGPPPRWVARALRQYGVRAALPPALHGAARRTRRARLDAGPAWLAPRLRERLDDARADDWKRRPGPRWWASLVHLSGPGSDALGSADQFRREAALAGIRVAHPWRDERLVDLILRLPPQLAFDPVLDRPLARAAMDGLVPDAVRLSDAKPFFDDLLADALTGPDRPLVADLAAAPALRPYLDHAGTQDLLRRSGGPGWAATTWRIAAAGAWLLAQADSAALDRLAERTPAPMVIVRQTAGEPA